MDDLAKWYDLLRSMLQPSYEVRLIPGRGILVGSVDVDEIVFLTADELSTTAPGQLLYRLQPSSGRRQGSPFRRPGAC